MIYFYEHKSMNSLSPQEIDLLGFNGVRKFAIERGLDPMNVFDNIKSLEAEIKNMGNKPFDMSSGKNLEMFNRWVDRYIDYFNNCAVHDKQAYIILGNIASGKTTLAKDLEQPTNSIIIDPDKFKMGEETKKGYFEGFTSLYHKPTDRERMQDPCSDAGKQVLKNSAELGLNIILPKAAYSLEKLEKQLQVLVEADYDIHLIQIEAPMTDCADRNYYRYLIKEYQRIKEISVGQNNHNLMLGKTHGRFVPVSIITNIGDNSYNTFIKAVKKGKFASYSAFYNDSMIRNEQIDIETMKGFE